MGICADHLKAADAHLSLVLSLLDLVGKNPDSTELDRKRAEVLIEDVKIAKGAICRAGSSWSPTDESRAYPEALSKGL